MLERGCAIYLAFAVGALLGAAASAGLAVLAVSSGAFGEPDLGTPFLPILVAPVGGIIGGVLVMMLAVARGGRR